MNNSLDLIAAYFEGTLAKEEQQSFEERCVDDPAFAEEVAEYIAMREALRTELQKQKRSEFALLYAELSAGAAPDEPHPPLPLKSGISIKKLSFYLAAACVLLVLGWFLWRPAENAKQLSENYIAANFSTLGLNMGGKESADQLQKGIAAFNAKKYEAAEQIFISLSRGAQPEPEAVKNLGITYLVTQKYDAAIEQFERLSTFSLYSNPGLFYQALALMKRGKATDREAAKKILQEVVRRNLAGSKEAKFWLQKL
ncbi:hypothetical protein [Pedobacter caeni]|uniref:Tetratricopeptide repeat-containing protein n=1 Tax=Pedobacter caeni TaxID=288992 RepID=A0A1M4WY54_9SPHI|nr:hypothetical protein [Pedobacter caeni]SHE86120.1 hypothetical protein SAMN04488522_1011428 [Pedobacter caeni]